MAFTPYVQDLDAWKKHFVEMAEGKLPVPPDGLWRVNKWKQRGGDGDGADVRLVTPTQQAVEMAQSEMKRESQLPPELLKAAAKLLGRQSAEKTRNVRKRKPAAAATQATKNSAKKKKDTVKNVIGKNK